MIKGEDIWLKDDKVKAHIAHGKDEGELYIAWMQDDEDKGCVV